ncbi:hypothetical protein ACFYYR_00975 [Streptomyces sp. NPDC001922]|uniref:hypothetical protein n=1 Tax=Streptomyces sp. NPDC001922 TaxID=3364624 RepID=UPI00368F04F5
MSDLKKEAESLDKASSALRRVTHHTAKPLHSFREASHDLSAFGALGSLMSATDDIRDGMHKLAKLTHALEEEWHAEAKVMRDVSHAFDLLDGLIAAAARDGKG